MRKKLQFEKQTNVLYTVSKETSQKKIVETIFYLFFICTYFNFCMKCKSHHRQPSDRPKDQQNKKQQQNRAKMLSKQKYFKTMLKRGA